MKKVILLLVVVLPFSLFAQNEITINIGSGLFLFGRYYSSKINLVEINRDFTAGKTANPYSSIPGSSFNLSADFKSIRKNKLVFGAETGYDYLHSLNKIDYALNFVGWFVKGEPTKTHFLCNDVYISPFIGKRFEKTPGILMLLQAQIWLYYLMQKIKAH